jgi:hypothetical protein
LPPPLQGPLDIPAGSIVEVLPPGINQTAVGGPVEELYKHPNDVIGDRIVLDPPAGRRFSVVEGPVSHRGTDWYLVQSTHGTSMHTEFLWAPATSGDRPLLAVVDPACPEGRSVEDLVWLIPAERVACFGSDELTIEPAFAARHEQFQGGGVDGTPEWLARDSVWQLFGVGGPSGVEGGMVVAIDPAVGTELPKDVALRVRGHFDDPAAATCERTFPEGWGSPETPVMQHLRCRQTFVVIAVEEVSAP